MRRGHGERMRKRELLRSLKFLLFSISAGVVQALSFTLCHELLHCSATVSHLIALILSVLWNFTLNRRYTFQSANNIPKAMLLVALFYAVFTPASAWLTARLADGLGWNAYLVEGINMVLNFVLEFLYDRFVVFRTSLDTNERARKEKEKNPEGQKTAPR